jgi:hypothetical protein
VARPSAGGRVCGDPVVLYQKEARYGRTRRESITVRRTRRAAMIRRVSAEHGGPSKARVVGARALTVLAVLLALVGMVAFYVEHTALDEDGFESISRSMIENDEIRTQVAAKSVDTLFENVDVEAAIAERLPPAQKGLAPVLAGLARSGADRAAEAALERPRVQTVWVETTTATQRQLVRLLDDETTFIQTEGGAVVLDLRALVIELGDQVAVIGRVAERLPESSGRIAIIEESQLETAQTITKILRAVANWMWLVALAVAALAVWLARGRRRLELRALAIGVFVVGLLMLAVRRFAGDYLVDRLAQDDAVEPAAHDAWEILTQTLADRAWVWIILGLVTLAGVWFVGETRRAGDARRAARPVLENRVTTYAVAAGSLLGLALVAWLSALILLALVVAGIEVVRSMVLREPK